MNPSGAVTLPKLEKQPLRTMDKGDVSAFLKAIQGDPYEIPLFVALFTGLRQGELLGLTWDCVDFKRGTLLINKQHNRVKGEKEFHFSPLKNSKARTITVGQEVLRVLEAEKQKQEHWKALLSDEWSNPDNLVFTTEFGRYINNKTLYMNFKRIMRKLGFPQFRFHDLRHTFATLTLEAGVDVKTVSHMLGHTDAGFTMNTYMHVTDDMQKNAADKMKEVIENSGKNTKKIKVPA